jgi:hypothetical protein
MVMLAKNFIRLMRDDRFKKKFTEKGEEKSQKS